MRTPSRWTLAIVTRRRGIALALPGLEMFQYGFMQVALAAGLLVAILCGALGVFLVLRGSAMLGDGLAHIAFGGLALGLVAHLPEIWMALAFAITAAIGIQLLRERGVVLGDTAIAIFFTTGLALGVILVSASGGFNVDLFSLLFGSLIAVREADLTLVALLGALVVATIALLYKEFFYLTFNEEAARVSGVPVHALNIAFSILTALTIVAASRMVGVLLVSALLVVPAATSLQIVRSFARAILLSIAIGAVAVIVGLYASFAGNVAMGGAIALASVVTFFSVVIGRSVIRYATGSA